MKKHLFILFSLHFFLSCSETNIDPSAVKSDLVSDEITVTFESHIEAFNTKHCIRCHNGSRSDTSLLLTNFDQILNSYKNGNSITRIENGTMPPNGGVTPEEIDIVREWRNDGFLEKQEL